MFNWDLCGWVVIVSYLVFIGEELLIVGDDVKEVCWFILECYGNKINLLSGEVVILFDLVIGEFFGKDILVFDYS